MIAPTVRPREERPGLGVVWMAVGVTFFTCIDASGKWLAIAGLPVLQVVFARYAGHFLVSCLIFLPREGLGAFISHSPWRQGLRACFLAGGTVLNFFALKFLPITVTTTIFFAVPIIVTLLAIPLLGERVGLHRIGAVCVGFVGVLVVVQPWGAAFHPALFFCLGALCCASAFFVMTRMLAGVDNNATAQLWSAGFPSLVLFPLVLPNWTWPQSVTDASVFLAIGLFGALGHIAATHAHRLADASLLSPVIYLQILTASAVGYLVFGSLPTVWTLVGAAIIIGSGLYIWHRERVRRNA